MTHALAEVAKNTKNVAGSNCLVGPEFVMANDITEDCARLLILEALPGNLAVVQQVWPAANSIEKNFDEIRGLTDQISRENIQLVIIDLSADSSVGLEAIQNIRRVHPSLPLLAVLPDSDLNLTLLTFRNGINDVLYHPLEPSALVDAWGRLSHLEQTNSDFENIQEAAKRSLDDMVLLKVVGETMRSAETLQTLLDQVVQLIQEALDVDIVSLMLADDQKVLKIRSSSGIPEDVKYKVTIAPGEGREFPVTSWNMVSRY